MKATEVLVDLAQRPIYSVQNLPQLSPDQLNAHVGEHPNSVAWLLWHSARGIDAQLAHLTGNEQLWTRDGFKERFNMPEIGNGMGFGQTSDQARAVIVDDQALLTEYLVVAETELVDYISSLEDSQLSDIVDESYDPPVKLGVRIVSIVMDAAEHIGQAYYVAGALVGRPVGPA